MAIYSIKSELLIDDTKPEGYIQVAASVYGGVDWYDDTIEPGAYDRVIDAIKAGTAPMPKMFFNHNYYESVPIGRWDAIWSTEKALYLAGPINLNLAQGREVYEAIKFGTVDGASVNIRLLEEENPIDESGIRHIKNVSQFRECSLCTFPADQKARIISYKSEKDAAGISTVRDLEAYLRDAGLPAAEAKTIISAAKRAFTTEAQKQRDAADLARLNAINEKLKTILQRN
jgi:HK97 family phage prohead protease